MAILAWDGCFNVRDLGGLPIAGGGALRPGVLVRADTLTGLSCAGWGAVGEAGVARVVDLRYLTLEPARPPAPLGIEVDRVELYPDDPAFWERADREFNAGGTLADYLTWQYRNALATRGRQIAAAAEAVAAVESGATVVHCHAGKDRTGVVVGVLLALAGVPVEEIVADYELSGTVGKEALARWVADAEGPEEHGRRDRLSGAPGAAMGAMVEALERDYGGASGYLLSAGVSGAALERLRDRLLA